EGSVDGGRTFREVSAGPPPGPLLGTEQPPGGGDTEIKFDHTGKQYFADLYALACLRTATTSDGGASVQNGIAGGCETSGPGADGYPAIDQVTGDVFDASGFQNADGTWSELLNIGTPVDAAGDLKFLDQGNTDQANLPSLLIHIADGLPGNPDVLFSVLSMDSGRNLFIAYSLSADASNPAQRQTFVAAASAASGWKTWTTPVQVSRAPSMVAVMPWIKAGGPGRADAVWYGSNETVDPSTSTSSTLAWDVYMSQVVFPTNKSGGITGAAPSATMVKATPHPTHHGTICLTGTGCITIQGNRNLADFFEVTIDSTGAAEIVYDDTSNGLIQAGFAPDNQQLVDHAGAGVVSILRQAG